MKNLFNVMKTGGNCFCAISFFRTCTIAIYTGENASEMTKNQQNDELKSLEL